LTEDIKHLTNNDTVVFWRGDNDVNKINSQDGLKHKGNFVKMNLGAAYCRQVVKKGGVCIFVHKS